MSGTTKVERVAAQPIPDYKESKVYISHHIVEVVTVQKPTKAINNYRRVSGNACVNANTGEYIPFSKTKSESDVQKHFKKAANDLRRIVNLNFIGARSEKFLTLTYGQKMTDYEQANEDFRKFWSLFKYRYPNCEYIRIIEPQGNGNWHIHVLIKDTTAKELYVAVEVLKELWNKGNVWIKNLPFSDNFGAYFSVQFSNLDEDKDKKSVVKGSRIKLYPNSFKFYTCSKGIKKPQAVRMPHGKVKEIVSGCSPCFSYTNNIIREDDTLVNSITYEQFNLKRGNKNEC